MCLPAVAAVAGIIGTAVSAVGTIQQGKAASASANYQAQVDRNNSIIATQNARDAQLRADEAAAEQMRKNSLIEGRARAAMASNGIELTSGSALDLLGDTAQFGALDTQTIRNNGEREAAGYRAQSSNFIASSRLNQMKASSATSGAYLGAVGSLLSGGGQVAKSWYAMS